MMSARMTTLSRYTLKLSGTAGSSRSRIPANSRPSRCRANSARTAPSQRAISASVAGINSSNDGSRPSRRHGGSLQISSWELSGAGAGSPTGELSSGTGALSTVGGALLVWSGQTWLVTC
jgi:hypothetical protein